MVLRRIVAVLFTLVLGTTVAPAVADPPGVLPGPAPGLLWLNINTGELSQWNLNGSGVVLGKTTWAMNCNYQSSCWVFDEMVGVAEMDGQAGYDLITRSNYYGDGRVSVHTDAKDRGMMHWTGSCGPECHSDAIGIRDFNRDGYQDVLWYSPGANDGHPVISLFHGIDSTASMTVDWRCSWDCYEQWRAVAVGDVNSDGYRDLLWWNTAEYGGGWLESWLLNGAGQVVGTQRLSWQCADQCRGATWNPIGLGDINGDGTQDLMWHNFYDGRVATWLLDGHGNVMGEQYLDWTCDYSCSQVWRPIGIVDPEHRRPIKFP